MGFQCIQSDHGLYIYLRDGVRILMPVFVDDITLDCSDGAKIDSAVQELSALQAERSGAHHSSPGHSHSVRMGYPMALESHRTQGDCRGRNKTILKEM